MATKANDIQIGGDHYKKGGEEHWDRAWRLNYDPFQYIITKWVERWKDKGGIQDLKKAQHAIQKYIEVVEREEVDGPETIPAFLPDTSHLNVPHPAVVEFGAERHPSGWIGYTFEGSDGEGDLFRCRNCKASFRTSVHGNPNQFHTCGVK